MADRNLNLFPAAAATAKVFSPIGLLHLDDDAVQQVDLADLPSTIHRLCHGTLEPLQVRRFRPPEADLPGWLILGEPSTRRYMSIIDICRQDDPIIQDWLTGNRMHARMCFCSIPIRPYR